MKRAAGMLIGCLVLQVVQSEILTLAVLALGAMLLSLQLIAEAGERGLL